jgi:hypothetical protein
MRRAVLLPFALALPLALAGCSLGTDPYQVVVGSINQASIVVPESATAGQAFQVSFRTVGSDGCWGRQRTDVSVSGMTATVTPYDRILTRQGSTCTLEPVVINHAASVTFSTPGEAVIRFVGLNNTFERTVTVR